jgi:glucan biosynthesis protein C
MNQALSESSGNRILFLDNIRYLMVVFVVLLHAAGSYGTFGQYWYVGDAVTTIKFFDLTTMIIDTFAMPVLFFIAGYFAVPNIQKKSPGVFLKDKLTRLGIPWLIGIILIVPIITYIYHYSRLNWKPVLSFGQLWINWIRDAIDFPTGFLIIDKSLGFFNHSAYWFISLLLFFFIIFAIIYTLKRRFFPSSSIQEKTHSGKTMLLVMLSVCLSNIMMRVFVNMIPSPYFDPWVIIAGVLQFQAWRLPVYIVYFALGVYAFSRNWFVKGNNFPGHPLLWISICIILCFGFGVVVIMVMSNSGNLISNKISMGLIITLMLLRSFLRETLLIAFASIAFRYWNHPHKITETLAANSYNIYLVHLPLVVFLQLLLVNLVGTSSLVKFGIVSSLSLLMSYAISKYAIKPYPRLSVAAVVVIFILLVIFVYPQA